MNLDVSKKVAGVTQDPLVMIQRFAVDNGLAPEIVSDIFEAGVVEFKKDGRLPQDACPVLHYRRAES